LTGTMVNRSQKFFKREFELLKKLDSNEYVLKAMEFTEKGQIKSETGFSWKQPKVILTEKDIFERMCPKGDLFDLFENNKCEIMENKRLVRHLFV